MGIASIIAWGLIGFGLLLFVINIILFILTGREMKRIDRQFEIAITQMLIDERNITSGCPVVGAENESK